MELHPAVKCRKEWGNISAMTYWRWMNLRPISRYFEPDDEGDLATVHTSIVSAHETLVEIDALYIRLTDISRGIIDGHI